jgi:ribokinase
LVSDTGDNQIVIVVGANSLLGAEDVIAAKEIFDRTKVLICQLETPILATVKAFEEFRGISILNAAPGQKNLPKELFSLPSIFCVNELEAEEITGLPVPAPK